MIADLPPTPPAIQQPARPPESIDALLARPRTKVVSANGLRFTYLEWGDPAGPLVLCLHGFPDSASTWRDLGPVLARAGYRVVAPWTRGYHPTEAPADENYSALALGGDALALITALGHQSAVVVGHDWGALAAYTAATLAPERVTKLVAVAIPHPGAITPDFLDKTSHFLTLPLPGASQRFAAHDVAGWDRTVAKWSPAWRPSAEDREQAKRPFRPAGGTHQILGYYRSFFQEALRTAAGQPPAVKFGPFGQPTLLIYGAADGALDRSDFERSRPFFTGAFRAVGLEGVGHFPQRERPAQFTEEVADFLGPAPRARAPQSK